MDRSTFRLCTVRRVGRQRPQVKRGRLMPIDTEALAAKYRSATVDVQNRKLLVTNFRGTEQEKDLTEPANCGGFGRIRHFHRKTTTGWPLNPLPIDPAAAALSLDSRDEIRAQVFQNA